MDGTQHTHQQITAFCQSCGSKLTFDSSAVGRKAKCLSCGHVFKVPDTRRPDPAARPQKAKSKKQASESPPKLLGIVPQSKPQQVNDRVDFDPLDALASSERSAKGEATEQETPVVQAQPEEIDVISNPAIDPQATVTALGVMLGLLYLALIAIGIILLNANLGLVLMTWILLPLVIVYGRKTAVRVIYLLVGKTVAARDPAS